MIIISQSGAFYADKLTSFTCIYSILYTTTCTLNFGVCLFLFYYQRLMSVCWVEYFSESYWDTKYSTLWSIRASKVSTIAKTQQICTRVKMSQDINELNTHKSTVSVVCLINLRVRVCVYGSIAAVVDLILYAFALPLNLSAYKHLKGH